MDFVTIAAVAGGVVAVVVHFSGDKSTLPTSTPLGRQRARMSDVDKERTRKQMANFEAASQRAFEDEAWAQQMDRYHKKHTSKVDDLNDWVE